MSKQTDKKENAQSDYDKIVDMCYTDAVVKSGGGLLLGFLTKVLFFKSHRWPLVAGAGIGLGHAAALCQTKLNALTAGPPCVIPSHEKEPPKRTYEKC